MALELAATYEVDFRKADASDVATVESSEWFDASWYLAQYADVEVSGISPAQHYLEFGEPWGRAAGPRFDGSFYRGLYPDVAKSGGSPLLHFIRYGKKEGRIPVELRACVLEEQLWHKEAKAEILDELKDLVASHNDWEASYAAWALGRWYAWRGEWKACAAVMFERHLLYEQKPSTPAPLLLEIDSLIHSGELSAAWQRIRRLKIDKPDYSDAWLAEANLLAAKLDAESGSKSDYAEAESVGSCIAERVLNDQMRLGAINALLATAGLQPLVLKQASEPLSLDNITGDSAARDLRTPENHGFVSVILPLFNAEKYLLTALEGLSEQSYPFFEVLIVDDASTDGSLAIAKQFCEKDKRFKVFSQPSNQGAYAARNRGLSLASGDLITVHDSDDWSHPEKLEYQVTALRDHPQWKACFTDLVRCTTAMVFNRWRLEANDGWIYRNTSSYMFRREVFEVLGYWDLVKVGGDTEYFQRLIAAFGPHVIGDVKKGHPLAFGRVLPTSLSQAGPTHLVTQFKGVRYDYRQAAAQWHDSAQSPSELYMPFAPDKRLFKAPAANLPG